MSVKNPKYSLELRRCLRKNMTPAEKVFWSSVRNKAFCGLKVRRQFGIGPYIVDFFIPSQNLAIEIDGPIHLQKENAERDYNRDQYMIKNGIRVIRFSNNEILSDMQNSLKRLHTYIIDKEI